MSEPTKLQLQGIVELFLDEYNKINNSSYKWDNNKSYVANSSDKKWLDAIAFDKKSKELQIQHKEVVWDVINQDAEFKWKTSEIRQSENC